MDRTDEESPERDNIRISGTAQEDIQTNPYLADAVNEVMRRKKWSFTQAQRETGITASTINRMTKGMGAKASTIMRFARAVKGDLARWNLIAVGMDPDKGELVYSNTTTPADKVYESATVRVENGTMVEFVVSQKTRKTFQANQALIRAWVAVAELQEPTGE
jgi:hypothetical protein